VNAVDVVRCKFATLQGWRLDWSEFSLRSGWGTVASFGRRMCSIVVMGIGLFISNPLPMPSQTPMQYEIKSDLKAAAARLDSLEAKLLTMPQDVAVLKEQTSRNTAALESMNTRSWGLIAMLLAWACRSLFLDLGGKESRARKL